METPEERRRRQIREATRRHRAKPEGRAANNKSSRDWAARRRVKDPAGYLHMIAMRDPECDLTREDIADLLEPMTCAWSGLPLRCTGRPRDPLAPSLDRIDNSRGHVRGNVEIVALTVQFARNDTPLDEFLEVLEAIRNASPPRKNGRSPVDTRAI